MAAVSRTARPAWLMTLADLALLLVGFFVFIQATDRQTAVKRAAMAAGIRDAFGGDARGAVTPSIAIDANIVRGFASGSADLPATPSALLAWAADGTRDPRTRLIVTGYADGTEADRLDGSALALAARRAAAVAAAIEADGNVPADRLRISGAIAPAAQHGKPAARSASVTISFDS